MSMNEIVKQIEGLFSRDGITELLLSENYSIDEVKFESVKIDATVADDLRAVLPTLIEKYTVTYLKKLHGPIVEGTLKHCLVMDKGNLELSCYFWETIKIKTSNQFKFPKNVERQVKDFMRVLGLSTIKASVQDADLSGSKPKIVLDFEYPVSEFETSGGRRIRNTISKYINDSLRDQIAIPRESAIEPEDVEFNSNIRITLKNGSINCTEKGFLNYDLYDDVMIYMNESKYSKKLSKSQISDMYSRLERFAHSSRVERALVKLS